MFRMSISVVAGCFFWVASASAEVLISEAEARLPSAPAAASRAITRGPGVRLVSPVTDVGPVRSPFPLQIAFEPRGGAKVDPSTVKLTYLRNPAVDLTDRIKAGLTEKGIDLKSAEVPPGEHQIRISLQDSEGRLSNVVLNLSVAK